MAVHAVSCTAMLLIVIQFSLSTALITTSHPPLPCRFLATIPVTSCCFSHLGVLDASIVIFDLPSAPPLLQMCQVITLLIVYSEDVFHVVLDLSHRVRNTFSSTKSAMLFVESANFVSVLRTHRVVPIDSFFSNVTRTPHICTVVLGSRHAIELPGAPNFSCSFLSLPTFDIFSNSGSVYDRVRHFSSKRQSRSPACPLCSPRILSCIPTAFRPCPFERQLVPGRTLDCASSISASISCVCLVGATMSCSGLSYFSTRQWSSTQGHDPGTAILRWVFGRKSTP